MTPAARLSAAIEVVADIEARHRPAADALKDWGLSHRFAGSIPTPLRRWRMAGVLRRNR